MTPLVDAEDEAALDEIDDETGEEVGIAETAPLGLEDTLPTVLPAFIPKLIGSVSRITRSLSLHRICTATAVALVLPSPLTQFLVKLGVTVYPVAQQIIAVSPPVNGGPWPTALLEPPTVMPLGHIAGE
jgi:hypothetical protein